MTTYLVRCRGISHICRPGAVAHTDEGESRLRLGWFGRDDSGLVCFDGGADDVVALCDDEPEPQQVGALRATIRELRAHIAVLENVRPGPDNRLGIGDTEGWHPWHWEPGEMPVSPTEKVDCAFRDGSVVRNIVAGDVTWMPGVNALLDIVMWRPAEAGRQADDPARPEGTGWERWGYLQDQPQPGHRDMRVDAITRCGTRYSGALVGDLNWRQTCIPNDGEILWWRSAQ